jgi:hypothetical protein
MNKLKFEITWEDIQHNIGEDANGKTISKKRACELLGEIEEGLKHWFGEGSWEAINDSLACVESN